jgi:hypothetical protein
MTGDQQQNDSRNPSGPNARSKTHWGCIAWTILAFFMLMIVLVKAPGPISAWKKRKEAWTKSNVHQVQIDLERWASDHNGLYPSTIKTLIQDGYFTQSLTNPFTKAPMREIAFGSSPFEGEFTYVPVLEDGQVRGFYLLAYGDKNKIGEDVNGDAVDDHVIMVVETGVRMAPTQPTSVISGEMPVQSEKDLPPLRNLLNALKDNPQAQSAASPEDIR